jgi:hypothetical protein
LGRLVFVPIPPLSGVQLGGMRAIATAIACLMFAAPLAAQQTQVRGSEAYAVVDPAADEAVARPFAEQHCAKYGRIAIFSHMYAAGTRAAFHCRTDGSTPPRKVPVYGGGGIY